jgi:hypothetical protein
MHTGVFAVVAVLQHFAFSPQGLGVGQLLPGPPKMRMQAHAPLGSKSMSHALPSAKLPHWPPCAVQYFPIPTLLPVFDVEF